MIIWNKFQITHNLKKLFIEEVDNRMFLQQFRKFNGFVKVDGDKHAFLVVLWWCWRGLADIGLVTYTPHDHNHCRQIIRTMIMNYKERAYKYTCAHVLRILLEIHSLLKIAKGFEKPGRRVKVKGWKFKRTRNEGFSA